MLPFRRRLAPPIEGGATGFGRTFSRWLATVLAEPTNDEGRQNYATYAEISHPFAVKSVDMKAAVGFRLATENCVYDRIRYVQNAS